ncbi:MAG: hypothetical protein OQK82_05375 [Candidatus Pacearchaeota archaeon]|nr:hypothetical protein [Candidatus Pacearchaeota archaeon]
MTNESLSKQNDIKLGLNDVESPDSIKYICEFKNGYMFVMPLLDNNGEVVYKTDAKGNNKVPETVEYKFTNVTGHKNLDGKVDPNTAFSFFNVSKEVHGADYDRIVAKLDKECKNPRNKMFREDDHFKKRNPEAFKIAEEKAKMERMITQIKEEKDAKIAELEKQLFGRMENKPKKG